MTCCSCPCLEAATHLVCAVCGGVVASIVVMATSPSLFISSQYVATWQSEIEKYKEVSVECSSGVVRVWSCLTWLYLVYVCSG